MENTDPGYTEQLTGTNKKILIIDDISSNLLLMTRMLTGYSCETVQSGRAALEKLKSYTPDIILLDVIMPDMDGYAVCRAIRSNLLWQHIPVIMITALEDKQAILKGLEAGANEFLQKPVHPLELRLRISNILRIKEYGDYFRQYNKLLQSKLEAVRHDLEGSYLETIQRLTMSAEFKDNDTGTHVKRVSFYARHIAEQIGYPNVKLLTITSQMHDIGKIGIPDHVLLKKGPLTKEEFDLMKTHTLIGAQLLEDSKSPLLEAARIVALHHHERWDGSGYPQGLQGEQIPIEGLIVAVADQYDALRMRRSYKEPFTHEEAVHIITQGDGRTHPAHFSPQILDVFSRTHHVFAEIFSTYQ